MITISKANTEEDIMQIAVLAEEIWKEHYIPIIGIKQVSYMLKKYQSTTAIKEQIEGGIAYFTFYYKNEEVGYLSYYKKKDSLFISKLYVLSTYRGKGIAKKAVLFVDEKTRELNCNTISLTVNKYNTVAIKAYAKMGFKNMDSIVIDIGCGYIMDDYFMVKEVNE